MRSRAWTSLATEQPLQNWPSMVIGIVTLVVVLAMAFVAFRVMGNKPAPQPQPQPPMVETRVVIDPTRSAPRPQPTPRPQGPIRRSLPPVTLETMPPPGLARPSESAPSVGLAPAIDRSVFAALAAAGSQPGTMRAPQGLARGSASLSFSTPPSDLDDAETLNGDGAFDEIPTRAVDPRT